MKKFRILANFLLMNLKNKSDLLNNYHKSSIGFDRNRFCYLPYNDFEKCLFE